VAPAQDLAKAFGEKASLNDIVLEILKKGDLQVGEKERQAELERVHNEVVDIVASKLVDPTTKRVYTHGMIEKALDQLSSGTQRERRPSNTKDAPVGNDASVTAAPENHVGSPEDKAQDKGKAKDRPAWTGVSTTKSAKLQALDAMKALIAHQPIPVARARMKIRVTCPMSLLKQAAKSAPKGGPAQQAGESEVKATGTVKDLILSYIEEVTTQDVVGDKWYVIGFVEPGAFKPLSEFIGGHTKGQAKAEVLDMAVMHGDG
jgi:ribosome maturation protein SDO1